MTNKKATLVIITLPENGVTILKDCIQFEKAELIDFESFEPLKVKEHKTAWTYKATNKASRFLGLPIKISVMYGVGNMTAPYDRIFAGIPREITESEKIKLRSQVTKFITPNRFKGLVSQNGKAAPDYVIDNKALRTVVKDLIGNKYD